jgi:NAD(P)-dependent dehydrogenase (short-subunit alcohol dehydrogenase family)
VKNRLSGLKALVTGAADGIGLAIARNFIYEDAKLFATDIQAERLRTSFSEDGEVGIGAFDLRNSDDACRVVDQTVSYLGGLDILVNAAGIRGHYGPLEEVSNEAWREVMSINADAAFYVCRAAIPHLRKSSSGRIINIGSLSSVAAPANLGPYVASKHAVLGLTRALAADLAPYKITANAILPSLIVGTGLTRGLSDERQNRAVSYIPLKRAGTPEEVAAAAVFLASREASYISGVALPLDGGSRAVL